MVFDDEINLEDIVCPECKDKSVEREHNLYNLIVGLPFGIIGSVFFYYWDIPFGPNYVCNNCDYELEDEEIEENELG